jgi:hypothetical protein
VLASGLADEPESCLFRPCLHVDNQKKPQLLIESYIGMVVLERLMVFDERRAAEKMFNDEVTV